MDRQPGAEFAEGAWWQAFNSATYFTDHVQGRDAESRLENQWYDRNHQRKLKAFKKAVEYARAA